MHRFRRVLLTGALALIGSLVVTSASAAAASPTWTFNMVVSSLANPRGIAFDGKGAMYVAEAGLPLSTPSDGVTNTGAVDKYQFMSNAWSKSWSKSFNSAYTHAHGAPETIGPSGMSARGNKVLMIMGLNHHEVPIGPAPQIGHLFQLNPTTGHATDRGDIGEQQWAWTNAHKSLNPQDFPDSNPYGVVLAHGEDEDSQNVVFVVDAGANTVSRVRPNGTTDVIAYIPNETPVAGHPTTDSTPTCAAQGPDGALYVGTLDLIRNVTDPNQGWSHVYRIELDEEQGFLGAAKVWASGLTTITSCGFDRAGNFWATEMFKSNGATAPPGDLVRIKFHDPAHPQHIGGGHLPFPGGVVQGPDGALYVTVNSAFSTTANGMVVRVSA
jgi:hypothetical protein